MQAYCFRFYFLFVTVFSPCQQYSSDFVRLATGVKTGADFSNRRSRSTIATCLVSAFNSLGSARCRIHIWSHGSRAKFSSRCCHPNGSSPCIFHCVSRTIHLRTTFPHEWASPPWSRHRERAAWHVVCSALANKHWRPLSYTHALFQQANVFQISTQRRHRFGSFCITVNGKTPIPRRHWEFSGLACVTLSVSSIRPRTSSTKTSSAKQSLCGDGPVQNAATLRVLRCLEGLYERLSRRAPPDSQRSSRADANPIFHFRVSRRTCTPLFSSAFARSGWFVNHDVGSLANADFPDSRCQRHMGPSILWTLGCAISFWTHYSFQDDAFDGCSRMKWSPRCICSKYSRKANRRWDRVGMMTVLCRFQLK